MDIKLSSLDAYPSRESFLKDGLKLTSSQIKKNGYKRKWLEKPVGKRDEVFVSIKLVNQGMISFSNEKIDILFENEKLLAFSKKIEMHSHPLSYGERDNMLSILFYHRPKLENINKAHYDRGLLYRLDYETSGLMIYAKDDETYHHYRDNFSKEFIQKNYFAIIEGNIEESGMIAHKLTQTGQKIKEHIDGKECRLEWKLIHYNEKENLSLIKVNLKEGVRHQIRVQLSLYGYPILGDTLYGGKNSSRLFLHCYEYKMNDGQSFKDHSLFLFSNFFDLNC